MWLVGAVPIIIGEWIRLAGVAAAGTVTRRRSRDVQRLVTYGIFGWVRNPLYVGNFLIWMGFVVISGVWWFLPVAIVIFGIEYTLIVRYEEGVLESIFGQEYLDYKKTTPRWFPRPPKTARAGRARLGRGVAERDQHVHAVRRARRRRSRSSNGFGGSERARLVRSHRSPADPTRDGPPRREIARGERDRDQTERACRRS